MTLKDPKIALRINCSYFLVNTHAKDYRKLKFRSGNYS